MAVSAQFSTRVAVIMDMVVVVVVMMMMDRVAGQTR
jgi:hypothetical protein